MSRGHLRGIVEIMDRVQENIQRRGCTADVRLPLPPIILCVQEYVCAGDADAHNDETK